MQLYYGILTKVRSTKFKLEDENQSIEDKLKLEHRYQEHLLDLHKALLQLQQYRQLRHS